MLMECRDNGQKFVELFGQWVFSFGIFFLQM